MPPSALLQFGHLFARGENREAALRSLGVALRDLVVRGEVRTIVDYATEMLAVSVVWVVPRCAGIVCASVGAAAGGGEAGEAAFCVPWVKERSRKGGWKGWGHLMLLLLLTFAFLAHPLTEPRPGGQQGAHRLAGLAHCAQGEQCLCKARPGQGWSGLIDCAGQGEDRVQEEAMHSGSYPRKEAESKPSLFAPPPLPRRCQPPRCPSTWPSLPGRS